MSKTSEVLGKEIDKAVNKYFEEANKAGKKVTRDEVIKVITKRLSDMIKGLDLDDERAWVASGIAVGVAIVLTIEAKLMEQNIQERQNQIMCKPNKGE